jgi:peptide/nickel transport system permease protein
VHTLAWIAAALLTTLICRAIALAGDTGDGTPWRVALARLRANRLAFAALCVIVALLVIAALAPWLAPYSPIAQPDIVKLKNLAPSFAHPFGTDFASRDVFSRALYGARVSLSVALLAIVVSASVGTAYGAIAGFVGGRVDTVMMRLIDAALSVPRILLLIAVLALWAPVPLPLLILLLGLTGWFGVSRVVRGQVLSLRERDMVLAARALGASDREILWRHILPNVISPIVVSITLGIANVLIVEAGLSYLGVGVRPPAASWGNMILDGSDEIASLWWISTFPGLAIVVTVMAFNLLGDGLRDALDPRQVDGS